METKVPPGSAVVRFRVLCTDRAARGCPPAGSIVYLYTDDYGLAEDDSRNDGCEFIACSINESGLPFFTIPHADVEPVSASENDVTTGDSVSDEGGRVILSEPRYSQPPTGTSGEYSVCQFFQDGSYEYVKRFVGAEEAMGAAIGYSSNVSAKFGLTRRVIITDGGDCINWEWRFGEGVVFPPPAPAPTHAKTSQQRR